MLPINPGADIKSACTDLCLHILYVYLQDMLIFPEVLTKQEVEDLNHMAEQVENFFKEKGWSIYCQMHGASIQALVIYIVFMITAITILRLLRFLQFIYPIEGLRERTKHLDIFLFSAHHSMVFYFRCSVY